MTFHTIIATKILAAAALLSSLGAGTELFARNEEKRVQAGTGGSPDEPTQKEKGYFERKLPSGALYIGESSDFSNLSHTAIGYPGLAIIDLHGGKGITQRYILAPGRLSLIGVNRKISAALRNNHPPVTAILSYACDESKQGTPEFYDRLAGGTLQRVIKVQPGRDSFRFFDRTINIQAVRLAGDSRTPGVEMDKKVAAGEYGYLVTFNKQPDGTWVQEPGFYTLDRLYIDPLVYPPQKDLEARDEALLGEKKYRESVCLIQTSPDLTPSEKADRLRGRPDSRRLIEAAGGCPAREELVKTLLVPSTR